MPDAAVEPTIGGDLPPRTGHNESYLALVWRRFRRSLTGMIGLVLVVVAAAHGGLRRLLRPDGSEGDRHRLRAAADASASATPTAASAFARAVYPIVETGEFDPVTFQPIAGPDYDEPARCSASSSRAHPTACSG